MNKRKSHDIDASSLPPGTPELSRPGQSAALRDQPDEYRAAARRLPPLRGSADPTSSSVQVDTNADQARDTQTGASVGEVLKRVGVPPVRQKVTVEASEGPPYLRHGR